MYTRSRPLPHILKGHLRTRATFEAAFANLNCQPRNPFVLVENHFLLTKKPPKVGWLLGKHKYPNSELGFTTICPIFGF